MRTTRLALGAAALGLTLSLAATAMAEQRVKGAEFVKPGTSVEQLYPQLIPLPITQEEIDLFLDRSGKVVAWAKEHKEQWKAIDKAPDAFTALAGLEVWKTVDLTSGEFIAVVIKLKIVQELESGNLDLIMLKQQYEFMRSMADNPQIPPESREELKKNLATLKSMLEGFENYPADNRTLYRSNKDKIDAALTAVESIGKDESNKGGAKPAAPKANGGDDKHESAPAAPKQDG